MLLIKAKVGRSRIEGLGLFAEELIPKGTVVWRYEPNLDATIDADKLSKFPLVAQHYLRRYAYLNASTRKYVLCFDDAKYFNHAAVPNTKCVAVPDHTESIDVALRDILPGEELTTNYADFDADVLEKLQSPSR